VPDFKAMLKPIRFDRPPEEAEADDVPAPLLRPADQARRFAALREASAIVGTIPGPGEAVHAIMTGRFDLADVVGALLEKLGTVRHLRIATLAMAARNATALKQWLTDGRVVRLSLLVSEFFRSHNPDVFDDILEFCSNRPGCLVAAARSHCKIVGFEFADKKFILTGSANLRTNSNMESFVLAQDGELADWYSRFIDSLIEKHAAGTHE